MSRVDTKHRITAAFVAVWIPFCCCFIQAAQAIVSSDPSSNQGSGPCCCSQVRDCSQTLSGDSEPADGESSCTNCCIRVLPDAPQDWSPPTDLLGQAILEVTSADLIVACHSVATSIRTRPPDPPPGMTLLSQHCLLLV